jgi:hypothetical protein
MKMVKGKTKSRTNRHMKQTLSELTYALIGTVKVPNPQCQGLNGKGTQVDGDPGI